MKGQRKQKSIMSAIEPFLKGMEMKEREAMKKEVKEIIITSKEIMKRRSILVLVELLAVLFTVNGCHDEPNPCAALHETSADFTIMEDFSYLPEYDKYWPYYACDTAITKRIRFTAIDSTASSYEWHIGSGIYNKRKVFLNFSNTNENAIPITLILKKTPNQNCFPKDDGIDTVTRKLVFVASCQSLIAGTYNGTNADDTKNPYKISFSLCQSSNDGHEVGTYVTNDYLGCNFLYYSSEIGNLIGYKAALLTGGGIGDGVCKWGVANTIKLGKTRKDIEVDFIFDADTITFKNRIQKKFIGHY